MEKGNPKDEYLDTSANQRQFMSLRFAQLTVFLAIFGILINALFSQSFQLPANGDLVIKIGGLVVTLLFWIHQERTMAYWNHFVRRAAELEEVLSFNQYRSRPKSGLLSSSKAMRLLFFLIIGFWIFSFFWVK